MDPKRTPGKLMQNILLEKAVQGKFPLSCDSPFRLFPSTSTPPSRLDKIKNPFEPQLTERLHQYVFRFVEASWDYSFVIINCYDCV